MGAAVVDVRQVGVLVPPARRRAKAMREPLASFLPIVLIAKLGRYPAVASIALGLMA